MTYDLSGRTAVVTGGLGFLGSRWCRALANAGARVLPLDLPGCDVTDESSLQRTQKYDRCDILVNAAGIDFAPGTSPHDTDLRVLDVNVRGIDLMCRIFGERMPEGSSIVNIGSLYASVSPDPRIYPAGWQKPTLYGASKAAVVNLTKQWAVRLAPRGIRVNCLSPGGVRNGQDEAFVKAYSERVPLGRMATVEDTIGSLLFLCSDASRYVTGHELVVDGGYTAW